MKLLVANRGEIAVRIMRTAREMGVATVAVYSEADAGSLHARTADESVAIGRTPPGESYLSIQKLLAAAAQTGCDAVHPGYGFLSENAGFAQAVLDAGLVWVGPPPAAIAAMGEKYGARERMRAAGVPVVPGGLADDPSVGALPFPLLVKATAGGGGRGMRIVLRPDELEGAIAAASAEALAAFGNGTVYVESLVLGARHIEVQVLADKRGTTVALGLRECSIQRRHQKLIEESPPANLPQSVCEAMSAAAVNAANAVRYVGAGTVEFLVAPDGSFYFIEMNTRIQVEHPVTELCFGVDLIREQLRIAQGEALGQYPSQSRGHAIEVRLTAEDPSQGFLPFPGQLLRWRPPSGPGIRVDSAVAEGDTVPAAYDSLLAKLVVHAADRPAAIARMVRALSEFEIAGVPTPAELCRDVLLHPDFAAGRIHTAWLETMAADWVAPTSDDVALIAAWILAGEPPTEAAGSSSGRPPGPWVSLGNWR